MWQGRADDDGLVYTPPAITYVGDDTKNIIRLLHDVLSAVLGQGLGPTERTDSAENAILSAVPSGASPALYEYIE